MIRTVMVSGTPEQGNDVIKMICRNPQIEVISFVDNSVAVLECIELNRVQLVIVDSPLAGSNGLDLLSSISGQYPDVLTLVISNSASFHDAQAAVKHKAVDYLVKPVDEATLAASINKIHSLVMQREKTKRYQLLEMVLDGRAAADRIEGSMYVMLLCAGAFPEIYVDLQMPGQAFWNRFPIREWLSEKNAYVFNGTNYSEKIIVLDADAVGSKAAQSFAKDLYNYYEGLDCDICITLVAHSLPVQITQIHATAKKLHSMMRQQIRLYQSHYLWCDCETHMLTYKKLDVEDQPMSMAVDAVQRNDRKQLTAVLKQVIDYMAKNEFTQMEASRFLDSLVNDKRIHQKSSYTALMYRLTEVFNKMTDPMDQAKEMAEVLLWFGAKEPERQDISVVVDQVECFLKDNYNKPITNELIAERFGYASRYITRVFRERKGMTPTDYLITLRVEKAKELLLIQPGMRIREVASYVGYNDSSYFSKLFKKLVGVWPTDYQKNSM